MVVTLEELMDTVVSEAISIAVLLGYLPICSAGGQWVADGVEFCQVTVRTFQKALVLNYFHWLCFLTYPSE